MTHLTSEKRIQLDLRMSEQHAPSLEEALTSDQGPGAPLSSNRVYQWWMNYRDQGQSMESTNYDEEEIIPIVRPLKSYNDKRSGNQAKQILRTRNPLKPSTEPVVEPVSGAYNYYGTANVDRQSLSSVLRMTGSVTPLYRPKARSYLYNSSITSPIQNYKPNLAPIEITPIRTIQKQQREFGMIQTIIRPVPSQSEFSQGRLKKIARKIDQVKQNKIAKEVVSNTEIDIKPEIPMDAESESDTDSEHGSDPTSDSDSDPNRKKSSTLDPKPQPDPKPDPKETSKLDPEPRPDPKPNPRESSKLDPRPNRKASSKVEKNPEKIPENNSKKEDDNKGKGKEKDKRKKISNRKSETRRKSKGPKVAGSDSESSNEEEKIETKPHEKSREKVVQVLPAELRAELEKTQETLNQRVKHTRQALDEYCNADDEKQRREQLKGETEVENMPKTDLHLNVPDMLRCIKKFEKQKETVRLKKKKEDGFEKLTVVKYNPKKIPVKQKVELEEVEPTKQTVQVENEDTVDLEYKDDYSEKHVSDVMKDEEEEQDDEDDD
ncbi:hypothetical protein Ciccas_011132 [Cichlidogyrus casuarinus]|uniref:Uncharacterized protein n=1 Tax=Cichlidogyrus casuarinus TaxID=1844966 RepID=A0ABD2PS59_9PLAT